MRDVVGGGGGGVVVVGVVVVVGGGILSRTWCDNMDLVRVWIWLGSKWITRLEALYDTLALGPADPRRAASIAHSRPGSC